MAIGTPFVIGRHGATSGLTNVITTTVDSPALNLIVVFTSSENSGTGAGIPVDSAGNTYAGDATGLAGSNNVFPNYASASVDLPLGGTITSTFQSSTTGNQMVMAISCSGVGGKFDNEGSDNKGTGTTPSATEGTVHAANRLVIGFVVSEGGATDAFTQSAGFTSFSGMTGGVSGGTSVMYLGYAIPTTTAPLTFAPILGASRNYSVGTISFAAGVPIPGAFHVTPHVVVAGQGRALVRRAFSIGTHTTVAGKTITVGSATGAITTHTTVAGHGASNVAQGTILTHTAVAGAGLLAKAGAGAITTHTVVAGKALLAGQAVGRIATHTAVAGRSAALVSSAFAVPLHTAVAGVTAATAASAFQINPATDVEGVGVSIWDWRQTVISQYSNSPSLLALILSLATSLNENANFQAFYDLVWNVDTAVGWGLDVWGRIVGVDRVLTISTEAYFSFQQAHNPTTGDPFGGGPFFSGQDATANFNLSDDAFRQLILAKAAANICDGSIPAINAILMMLFSELGNCYVTDNGNMQMSYTFSSPLNPVQYAIITESGVLPKPVGVAASIVQL